MARPRTQLPRPGKLRYDRAMKLTPFAKVFIALVVLGVVGYVLRHKMREGLTAYDRHDPAVGTSGPSGPSDQVPSKPADRPGHIVIGVNDFGGAYPLLLANDGVKAGPRSLFKKAGLDVEIKLIRGSKERLRAFDDRSGALALLSRTTLPRKAATSAMSPSASCRRPRVGDCASTRR